MNRDEQLARPTALGPQATRLDRVRCLYPREASGGTWIGVNEHGTALALLNWNLPLRHRHPRKTTSSRGEIIPRLLSCSTVRAASARLRGLDLKLTPPFRLVGVFPAEQSVREWRWDGLTLNTCRLLWRTFHWYSSSLGDDRAASGRAAIMADAADARKAGRFASSRTAWLRRLHRAHGEQPGPFGICVHRPEVGSVSYTEVLCQPQGIRCYHLPGPPCRPAAPPETRRLKVHI